MYVLLKWHTHILYMPLEQHRGQCEIYAWVDKAPSSLTGSTELLLSQQTPQDLRGLREAIQPTRFLYKSRQIRLDWVRKQKGKHTIDKCVIGFSQKKAENEMYVPGAELSRQTLRYVCFPSKYTSTERDREREGEREGAREHSLFRHLLNYKWGL